MSKGKEVNESPAVEKQGQEGQEVQEVKKETPVKEMPKPKMDVEPGAVRAAEFYFTPQGVEEINNYLALANQAEVNGILEYRSAFHKMVELVRGNLKTK